MRLFWAPREVDPGRARTGREVLRRLTEWRVLARLPRQIGGVRAGSDGHVYVVGTAGRKLLGRRGVHLRRSGLPGDRYLRHTLATTEAVVALQEAHRSGTIDLLEVQTEPRCHRSFVTGFGSIAWVKPDLFVRVGVGAYEDRYLIEIDLATEARGTIQQKVAGYQRHFASGSEQREHGIYPQVLWLVPDSDRAERLQEYLDSSHATEGMHEIRLQRELVRHVAAGAAS
jgi:hypothetical protein